MDSPLSSVQGMICCADTMGETRGVGSVVNNHCKLCHIVSVRYLKQSSYASYLAYFVSVLTSSLYIVIVIINANCTVRESTSGALNTGYTTKRTFKKAFSEKSWKGSQWWRWLDRTREGSPRACSCCAVVKRQTSGIGYHELPCHCRVK